MSGTAQRATLLISPVGQLEEQLAGLARELADAKSQLLVIGFNKPQVALAADLKKAGVKMDSVYFVDTIAKSLGSDAEQKQVTHVENPADLTGVQLAVADFVAGAGEDAVVMVDALATMLIYNDAEAVIRFTRELVEKGRAGRVVVLTPAADATFMAKISVFFDEVIEADD